MQFTEVQLHPDLLKGIADAGFETMTPIQEQCIGPGLEGKDIAGISQTGTGKTVAFLLPILQDIFENDPPGPAALIVTPTRELCLQIAEEAAKLCKYRPVEVLPIYGGAEYREQEAGLARGAQIIAATPGRLIDYIKQKKIDLSAIKHLVLDEADRMFDMGFIRDVRYIMRQCPSEAQTQLFSATLSYYVLRLASDFMHDPVEVRIEANTVAVDKIDQQLVHLGRAEKDPYLVNQILTANSEAEGDAARSIVFTNFRHKVEHLQRLLRRYGVAATGISSLLDQKKRIRLLKDFKQGKYSVLVATDVASRGLDVDDITHVFNYDLPQDGDSYVHRIGRTARAGKTGTSISYCSEDDYESLPRIHRYIGQKIPSVDVDTDKLTMPNRDDFTPFRDGSESADRDGERPERSERSGGRSRGGRRRDRGGRGGEDRENDNDNDNDSGSEANEAQDDDRGNRRDSGGEESGDGERGGRRRRRRRGGRGRRGGEKQETTTAPSLPDGPIITEDMSIRERDRLSVLYGAKAVAAAEGSLENDGRGNGGRSERGGSEGGGGRRRRRRGGRGRNRNRDEERSNEQNDDGKSGRGGSGSGSGGGRRRRGGRGRGGRDREERGDKRGDKRGDHRGRREETAKPKKSGGLLSRITSFFKGS